MASVIDTLPQDQRQKIIDALMAGKALREVAKLAGISHTAVDTYKKKVFIPTLQAAAKINAVQELARTPEQKVVETATLTRAALVADPFISHMEAKQRERAEVAAEARANGDIRSWAAVDRNDISATELHARLAGRLESAPSTQVNMTFVAVSGTGELSPAGDVIDIEPTE